MPLQIPGSAIRPPKKPTSKKCPKCKRGYNQAKVISGYLVCPFCGHKIGRKVKDKRG